MNGWNEYAMKHEQYRDQLREADRRRLVKLATDNCREAASGQAIRNLALRVTGRWSSRGRVPCGEYNHLLEKAA
jgi:hypothetical protein